MPQGNIKYQFCVAGYLESLVFPWYPDRFCRPVCFFLYFVGDRLSQLGVRFKDMIRLMCANPETTRPVVDKVFPFEKAKEAYAYHESQAHVGKVVIKVSNN